MYQSTKYSMDFVVKKLDNNTKQKLERYLEK